MLKFGRIQIEPSFLYPNRFPFCYTLHWLESSFCQVHLSAISTPVGLLPKPFTDDTRKNRIRGGRRLGKRGLDEFVTFVKQDHWTGKGKLQFDLGCQTIPWIESENASHAQRRIGRGHLYGRALRSFFSVRLEKWSDVVGVSSLPLCPPSAARVHVVLVVSKILMCGAAEDAELDTQSIIIWGEGECC